MDDTSSPSAAPIEVGSARGISVEVDAARLSAVVTVRAGPVAGEAELRRALEGCGVVAGIDEAAVALVARGLLEPAFEIRRVPIAQGRAATAGEAGRFESFIPDGLQPGHVREDGTIDFHDRELLKPVRAGDPIGRIWPARRGVAGQRVDGSPVEAAPAQEAKLTLGPGAERADDGVVRATRSGVVRCNARTVEVVERHVHEADVDLHSGHLHMLGSLVVKGDVHNTFGVYASGDVEIRGSVDNGSVYGGGNVWIHRGVRGPAGTACAEGNLVVQHAEAASLYAGGLLQVGEALHAKLSAVRVEVTGKLRGGVTSAELSAVVGEAGLTQARSTEIAVAQPLELPVEAAKRQLERAKMVRGKRLAGGGSPRGGSSAPGKGGKEGRVEAGLQDAETRRLVQRARRRDELCAVAFIDVRLAYAGVTLRVGDQKLLLEEDTRATRFTLNIEARRVRAVRIRP